MSNFISVKQAAAIARVHPNTVKRWCRASEAKVAVGGDPDFIYGKPGGTRNARLRIELDSFVAFLSRHYQPQPRMRDEPDNQPRQESGLIRGDQDEVRFAIPLVELPHILREGCVYLFACVRGELDQSLGWPKGPDFDVHFMGHGTLH